MLRLLGFVGAACCAAVGRTAAQTPITRADAVAAATTNGARLEIARADTAIAHAGLITARAVPNPTLAASYTKDIPNYHMTVDLPLEWPGLRRARIGSAQATRRSAHYKFALERAGAALDADTTYTRVLAARDKSRLSRRNAGVADSLRRLVVARRDAGDASDLDVELATVVAGQAANASIADSLIYLSLVLDLQIVMGLIADRVAIVPTDSLELASLPEGLNDSVPIRQASTLQIAAAEAAVQAARLNTSVQRRSVLSALGIVAGFDTGNPAGEPQGLLPVFGISIPLPIFNRNRGPIAQARAEQARAVAELSLAQAQSHNEIARARRELAIAYARVERDRLLVAAANRVSALSLTAYREGATPLHSVLESQRDARDVLAQYIADVADVLIFAAELRVITLTP